MIFQKNLVRKIWWAGRMGTINYLMFIVAIINFILIAYSFLIEGNPIFEEFISNMGVFFILFIVFYVPVGILIGRWHTNTQVSVEQIIRLSEDPILANMIKGLLDSQTGNSTKEELEKFRNTLIEIEKKGINEF